MPPKTWQCSVVSVAPIVLAGGQSRRMGRDKALLPLPGGNSLLQRASALLASLQLAGAEFLPPLISGGRPGGVADRVAGKGPLSGLNTVSEYLRCECINCDALLAIPVDMPLLQPKQLQQLCLAGLDAGDRPVCFGDFYLPLWLPLTQESRAYLNDAEAGSAHASIRAMLAQLDYLMLPVPEGNWHLNMNRPEEFSALLQVYEQSL